MRKLAVIAAAAVVTVALVACVTDYTDPVTGATSKVPNTNAVNQAVDTARGVNAATAPVNPYAPVIDPLVRLGGEVVLGASALWAAWLNARKKKVLAAVVQGVESAANGGGNSTAVTIGDVKAAIKQSAGAAGVLPDLHQAVQDHT